MRIMAVIKANAYGHGLSKVADTLSGVDAFAVARLDEARQLRIDGITTLPVVLLEGVWSRADLDEAAGLGCELVVHCTEQLDLLERHSGSPVPVWLKVDTGLTRLGFDIRAAAKVLGRLRKLRAVAGIRLMTHFASADEVGNPKTAKQLERFAEVATGFDGDVSVANSAALFGWSERLRELKTGLGFTGEQWVRPGIALYGVSPFSGRHGAELGLVPAMTFEARLIAVKSVSAGETIGYTERFRVEADTTVGVIAAGYGDGYSRGFPDGTPVLLNGRRVPLAGVVSMDMLTVDLGPESTDRVGDIATLWGEALPVEEVSSYSGALPYTVVCGVMHRETGATPFYDEKKPILTPAS
jgi:alanine racemase